MIESPRVKWKSKIGVGGLHKLRWKKKVAGIILKNPEDDEIETVERQ